MELQDNPRRYLIGDSCICWSFGNHISREMSFFVLGVYRRLKENLLGVPGVQDLVPAYTELAVHFDPVSVNLDDLIQDVERIIEERPVSSMESGSQTGRGKVHPIPVIYDGEDLKRVSENSGLPVAEVARLHAGGDYVVAMVGFLPHFPYLIGLDKRLETPRLDVPRKVVPAGSVAIGGEQTGIYPRESPGGWNIIGRTDPARLVVIEPGDSIQFQINGKL